MNKLKWDKRVYSWDGKVSYHTEIKYEINLIQDKYKVFEIDGWGNSVIKIGLRFSIYPLTNPKRRKHGEEYRLNVRSLGESGYSIRLNCPEEGMKIAEIILEDLLNEVIN